MYWGFTISRFLPYFLKAVHRKQCNISTAVSCGGDVGDGIRGEHEDGGDLGRVSGDGKVDRSGGECSSVSSLLVCEWCMYTYGVCMCFYM